ncbi:MAG: hypothetical protein HFJ50_06265 [Clostridia bacterium]|jgi:hypothetical protein|nr:hypothetical protein [Clostridia bacterium]
MEFKLVFENKDIKIILLENNEEKGSAICYFEDTPILNNGNIGAIGEFKCENKEYGVHLLKKCEEVLKEKGRKFIVLPMNRDTWHKYRVLKYTSGEDSFLLENVNPMKDNEIFLNAGFNEIFTYTSTKGKLAESYKSQSLDLLEEKIKENNITIRKFDKNNYINDLKEIYDITIKSFEKNPFYIKISEDEFLKQYEEYIKMVDEELILIAEKDGKGIGFVFCIPDFNEMKTKRKNRNDYYENSCKLARV